MRILVSIVLIFSAFMLKAQDIPKDKGHLVSYKLFRSYDKKGVAAIWKEKGIPKFIAPVTYGVNIYEIVYMAPWVDGTMIKASGLYFVPKNSTNKKLPIAVYHHGTQLEKKREDFDHSAQQGISFGLASDGFNVLMPDYYGIGEGEKVHLYQHSWSEAMSTIYMLYAIDELNDELNIKRSSDIYLTGYSQGGHATMAAHKYLQELNDPRFKVVASSPMSGAYDMSGAQSGVMFKPYTQPFYLPYLLVSYQAAYNAWDGDIYQAFQPPYDTIIPPFFNGQRTFSEFNKVLPEVPSDMLQPALVKLFKANENIPMVERIKENNIYEWVPEAPMLLCHCHGDEQVYYKNSEVAYNYMTEHGAKDVRLEVVSKVLDHNTCALFAVMDTKFFFNNIRDGKPNKKKYGPPLKRMLINIYKRKQEKKYLKHLEEEKRKAEDLRADTK
jgi:pimeloyl-ACP methyl ester carboxylesterase